VAGRGQEVPAKEETDRGLAEIKTKLERKKMVSLWHLALSTYFRQAFTATTDKCAICSWEVRPEAAP
jgi:hypothetical protein